MTHGGEEGAQAVSGGAFGADAGVVHARVFAGDVEVRYAQAGEGSPVLVLCEAAEGQPAYPLFFRLLARHFRAIAPESSPSSAGYGDPGSASGVAFSSRLRGLIDGLGLGRVSLVAEGSFGTPALAFSLSDPERVDRVALVFQDADDPVVPSSAACDAHAPAAPVVVLRVGVKPESVGGGPATMPAELLHFLTASAGASLGGPDP